MQRCRGQPRAGSWAAGELARLGAAAGVTLLVATSLATTTASAASHGTAAGPSPQIAPPLPSPEIAAPDPAPQAASRTVESHPATPPPSSVEIPAAVPPVETAPARATAPPRPYRAASSHGAVVTASSNATVHPGRRHRHSTSRRRSPPRRAPAVHRTKPAAVSSWFPFAFLRKAFLALPRVAVHPGAESHRGGILLLLCSVAMGVLAVSSFALLRRLKRLARPA